jgi:molybdopterin-guanine dinucleotide biosynthesis protein A
VAEQAKNRDISGLVLAGGRSSRMGADKGSLVYGESALPQVNAAFNLLDQVCGEVWVSVNETQTADPLYSELPTIVDTRHGLGPAAGLQSAFAFRPDCAWLVLAVDMPRVSSGLLRNLIEQRDSGRIATVHCHADGAIEPLCAIWEAHAAAMVSRELESGRRSLRKLAKEQNAAVARLPEPEQLRNVNTPDERSEMQEELASSRQDSTNGGRHGA